MERVVNQLNVLAQVKEFTGLDWLLQRPFIVMRIKDANVRHDFRIFDCGRQQLDFFADLGDFLERPAVSFAVVRA